MNYNGGIVDNRNEKEMEMKYFVTFAQDQGQYMGTHWFMTRKAQHEFIAKALRLGHAPEKVGKK